MSLPIRLARVLTGGPVTMMPSTRRSRQGAQVVLAPGSDPFAGLSQRKTEMRPGPEGVLRALHGPGC